jgi:hypothetical protein
MPPTWPVAPSTRDPPTHFTSQTDPDGDVDGVVPDVEVAAQAWEVWRDEVAFADRFVAEAPDLDVVGNDSWRGPVSLRWVLVHMCCAPGSVEQAKAVEQTMPAALRQRCLVHRPQPAGEDPHERAAQGDGRLLGDVRPARGHRARPGRRRPRPTKVDDFARRWRDSYPAALRILLADREALTHYLLTPREHWTRVRHSNLIERTFGETRRRVKVIGRLAGETSCVSLVWAVLDRSSRGAHGVHHDPRQATPAPDLRRQPLTPPTPLRHTPTVHGRAARRCRDMPHYR